MRKPIWEEIGAGLLIVVAMVSFVLALRPTPAPAFTHTLRFTQTNLLERTTYIIMPVTPVQWHELTNKYPAHVRVGAVKFE
jgi:hypothetical protein